MRYNVGEIVVVPGTNYRTINMQKLYVKFLNWLIRNKCLTNFLYLILEKSVCVCLSFAVVLSSKTFFPLDLLFVLAEGCSWISSAPFFGSIKISKLVKALEFPLMRMSEIPSPPLVKAKAVPSSFGGKDASETARLKSPTSHSSVSNMRRPLITVDGPEPITLIPLLLITNTPSNEPEESLILEPGEQLLRVCWRSWEGSTVNVLCWRSETILIMTSLKHIYLYNTYFCPPAKCMNSDTISAWLRIPVDSKVSAAATEPKDRNRIHFPRRGNISCRFAWSWSLHLQLFVFHKLILWIAWFTNRYIFKIAHPKEPFMITSQNETRSPFQSFKGCDQLFPKKMWEKILPSFPAPFQQSLVIIRRKQSVKISNKKIFNIIIELCPFILRTARATSTNPLLMYVLTPK